MSKRKTTLMPDGPDIAAVSTDEAGGFINEWDDGTHSAPTISIEAAVARVRAGQAASHQGKGWERFTDRVIGAVNDKSERVVFLLWGAPSRKKKSLIDTSRHTIIESAHPSPLSAHNGFFGSRPFSRANEALREAGRDPIDWQIS